MLFVRENWFLAKILNFSRLQCLSAPRVVFSFTTYRMAARVISSFAGWGIFSLFNTNNFFMRGKGTFWLFEHEIYHGRCDIFPTIFRFHLNLSPKIFFRFRKFQQSDKKEWLVTGPCGCKRLMISHRLITQRKNSPIPPLNTVSTPPTPNRCIIVIACIIIHQ